MSSRHLFGAILILLGIGFLLERMGYGDILSTWWPSLLILIGAFQLARRTVAPIGGIILVVVGTMIQARKLDFLPYDFAEIFWPSLIIFVGLWLIFSKKTFPAPHIDSDNQVNHFVMFSGLKTRNESQHFQGGSATAFFGGIEIDLRNANISEKEVFLDLTAAFGGIDIRVPENWKVHVSGIPLFGGYDNKTVVHGTDTELPLLRVRCFAAFGGIDIKN